MSESLRSTISNRLKEVLKGKDQISTSTIRLIIAALKDRDINARTQGKAEGISDKEILSMLQSMIKQRQESALTYREANRDDLADREEAEIEVIQQFLPKQMNDTEICEVVDQLIKELNVADIQSMGKVMGALKERYAGQLDMSHASGVVKERLAG